MDYIKDNLILLVHAGSHAYGMATETSDVDLRGVTVPPRSVREHLFNRFEQAIGPKFIEEDWAHLRNPKNPVLDGVVYGVTKFIKLASDVNPNVIELLFADHEATLFVNHTGMELKWHRELFLSRRAAFTTTGYAVAQLKKIQRHKKWLDNPPSHQPTRAEFGLPEGEALNNTLMGVVKKRMEDWNFHHVPMDDEARKELKQGLFDLVNEILRFDLVDWDNWPQVFRRASMDELKRKLELSDEMTDLIHRESRYRDAKDTWDSYTNWRDKRNKKRAEIEKEVGFDAKHASHLVRLLRMGYEIITEGVVRVRRPDAQELLDIRRGSMTYEEIVAYAEKMEKDIIRLRETSPLPREVDREAINELHQRLTFNL